MSLFELESDDALETYARALEKSPDYRVLRRLPNLEEIWLTPTPSGGPAIRLAVVDTETTGLSDSDKMIEFAVVKLALDDEGQLCKLSIPFSGLEDPGVPLSPAIEKITGISDEILVGRCFDEELLRHQLDDVDAIVAFNSRFDAAFWRRRFPWLGQPWICAYRDHDWAGEGHAERSQAALLAAKGGLFYSGHRAATDAWALAILISMQAADGRTIAANLVDAARRPSFRIAASGAPFATRDDLKERGYRWCPRRRVWSIDVSVERRPEECEWLEALHPFIRPVVDEVDWFNKHID